MCTAAMCTAFGALAFRRTAIVQLAAVLLDAVVAVHVPHQGAGLACSVVAAVLLATERALLRMCAAEPRFKQGVRREAYGVRSKLEGQALTLGGEHRGEALVPDVHHLIAHS